MATAIMGYGQTAHNKPVHASKQSPKKGNRAYFPSPPPGDIMEHVLGNLEKQTNFPL
jgi:hypothetical protein